MINRFFPVVTGLVLVGAGVAALRFDKPGADLYGMPTSNSEALGFVRAAGIRNVGLGTMLLAAPTQGRALLFAATVVSLLDFINVFMTASDPPTRSLAIHAGGIALLPIFASLTPRPQQ